MELTRNLKEGMSGDDVRLVKDWLFHLGFYSDNITKITHSTFGRDTTTAVKLFQKTYGLTVDGIVGKKTWAKLQEVMNADGQRISKNTMTTIEAALKNVSAVRKALVLEALKYATEASIASHFEYPSSLYIRGGNLYNTDDSLNVITEKYLTDVYAKNSAQYCTNGRLDMMVKAASINPSITGADCSGGIVGLLRHFGLVPMTFDATANGLCHDGYSVAIDKDDLKAGDYVGRDGHICLYVGAGYMIEWAGGAYGCQLTQMSNHRAWSFTEKKFVKQTACTKYRRPLL